MVAILDLIRLGVMKGLAIMQAYVHTCIQHSVKLSGQYIHNFFYIIIFVLHITGIDTIVTEQWRPSWI